jgi:hypothetical protein
MKTIFFFALLTMAVVNFTGCSETTHSHEEHTDAVGLRILSGTQTIVEYIRDGTLTGHIEAYEGAYTENLVIEFYNDENDQWFAPEDDHFSLQIAVEDTSIAQYQQDDGHEGSFVFRIRGIAEGQTHVVFSVFHDGHADFVSREIDIHVVGIPE